ncbi:MAG: valine--pyruvate transaminase [Gammaproteobacteria bacterium]|nr:MAG: valine--pyruvate transaminase [Gammaproteobacteria bacterium]
MTFSRFGERFTRHTGTRELMDDLGAALGGDEPLNMLGGGNPAQIPAMLELFRREFARILADERDFRRLVADYADPVGEQGFRAALSRLLRDNYGWPVGPEHVALTAGSQSGFFLLFNLLAGPRADGRAARILLPLTPEYVGYQDLGVTDEILTSRRPAIERLPDRQFKYHVDFAAIDMPDDIAAVCVSRPTNPTGNVLTDDELQRLAAVARGRDVPLILDSAYGLPFPRIVFTDAMPYWDDNVILCLSLSKLGLPGVRTGIVVARPEIVAALGAATATTSLAVGSVGPVLMRELIASGEIVRASEEVIRPFYRQRSRQALEWLAASLEGCDYRVHRPEGAFFLWLWLPSLPITSAELYRRLKARGTFVLSGHHFFPGLAADWPHRHECLRISYAQPPEVVRAGLAAIGEEVRRAFAA